MLLCVDLGWRPKFYYGTAKERWVMGNGSRGVADRDVVWLSRTGVRPREALPMTQKLFGKRLKVDNDVNHNWQLFPPF